MTSNRSASTRDLDPLMVLRANLQDLYLRQGEPSTRTIAKKTGHAISHTTVSKVLRCAGPPRWGQLELVVEALDGHVETFREAWIEVRSAIRPSTGTVNAKELSGGQTDVEHLHAEIARLRRERDDLLMRLASSGVRALEEPRPGDGVGNGPTVLRILLGAQLRRLRKSRGISPELAAYEIRGSEAKINRLELGRTGFKEHDLINLLALYGVVDPREHQAVLELARQANTPAWWHRYADFTPTWFQSYLGLEEFASVIRTHETRFLPGLLQTPAYARAVVLLGHNQADADDIQRQVDIRLGRQRILDRHDPPQIWAIIDETVLRRMTGGPKVMREQVANLIEFAKLPNIKLQIVRFAFQTQSAIAGPFTLLRFPDRELSDVVYIEELTSASYLDKSDDVKHYAAVFEQLTVEAESPSRTEKILRDILMNLY